MLQPLISIIIPTKNSAATLGACLESVAGQTYPHVELIVVDNYSSDGTAELARQFTNQVYTRGPERSAQRNFGVDQARGEYVLIIDSDMELDPGVVAACAAEFAGEPQLLGLVIPEESFGDGFWAQCKRLERSFYVGVPWLEAARCFRTAAYREVGGYDETMVSGEDWDLSRRVGEIGPVGRVPEFIRHNEGRLRLIRTLRKKYYYAQRARAYLRRHPEPSNLTAEQGPLRRYQLLLSRPGVLLRRPLTAAGMLFLKTAEFAAGGLGYALSAGQSSGGPTGQAKP